MNVRSACSEGNKSPSVVDAAALVVGERKLCPQVHEWRQYQPTFKALESSSTHLFPANPLQLYFGAFGGGTEGGEGEVDRSVLRSSR